MGNQTSVNKINFEDMQYAIKNQFIIINTLSATEQDCLIKGTIHSNNETDIINNYIKQGKTTVSMVIYGKNSNDITTSKKYEQLMSLGFINIYLYNGGLFEWLLLQDIYGDDNFPTTKKNIDLLKYKSQKILNMYMIDN
jgi:hypothetical protein